jgi:hypothetical protein
MDLDKALALPIAVQIALGSGYLAYMIAYAGLREKHTATDAIFRAVAFGLVATAVLTSFDPARLPTKICAVLLTVLAGAGWRWIGMELTRKVLRRTDISWTDDIPTAWLSITAVKTDARISQIAVDLDDGRTVVCEDTRRFVGAPHGPCVFGLSGDLGIYVTAEMRANGEWFSHEHVLHDTQGANMTYLPASKIKRVELRFWTNANGKAAEAAAATALQAEAEVPEV